MIPNQASQATQSKPQMEAKADVTMDPDQNQNTIWTKSIPLINKFFLVLSLIFVFGLDLIILISSFSLIGFWLIMLLVFCFFLLFFLFENRMSKKFANTKTSLDEIIYVAIVLRNIAFFLNFIPFIQILGMSIVVYAGIPYLVIYYLLIRLRYKRS